MIHKTPTIAWPPGGTRPSRSRRGLTVIELLVVAAVIALVVGFLLPAVASVRESARRLQCSNNLHQIGIALHAYHDAHRALPPGWHVDRARESALGWMPPLAPYLERADISPELAGAPLTDPQFDAARNALVSLMLCPSDNAPRTFGLYSEHEQQPQSAGFRHEPDEEEPEELLISLPSANYVGLFGSTDPDAVPGTSGNGAFIEGRPIRFAELQRGLTQSLFVGERTARKLPSTWMGFLLRGEDAPARVVGYADQGPNRDDADECELDSRHPGCVNFLWGDGHVDVVRDSISPNLDRRLARRTDP